MSYHAKLCAKKVFDGSMRPCEAIKACDEPKPTKQAVYYYVQKLIRSSIEPSTPPATGASKQAADASKPVLYAGECANASEFRSPNTRFTVYAGLVVAREKLSGAKAAKKAMDAAKAYGHSGVTITREAARQASHKPGVEPLPKGRPPALPKDAEAALYELVLLFRAMKFPLFKSTIMNLVNCYLGAHEEKSQN